MAVFVSAGFHLSGYHCVLMTISGYPLVGPGPDFFDLEYKRSMTNNVALFHVYTADLSTEPDQPECWYTAVGREGGLTTHTDVPPECGV